MRRLLAVLLAALLAGCAASEEEVKAEFEAFVAAHDACSADQECVLVSPGCPLGCGVAVSARAEQATVREARELIDDYERGGRSCDYECIGGENPVCDDGHCALSRSEPPNTGRGCTAIGCGSPFSVRFSHAASWQPGSYRVLVDAGDTVVECSATLPLVCDAEPPCDAEGVQLLLEGCALDPSAHALGGVELLEGAPERVAVQVRLDDVTLVEAEWSPQYERSHPNGPDCDPECLTAPQETLQVP